MTDLLFFIFWLGEHLGHFTTFHLQDILFHGKLGSQSEKVIVVTGSYFGNIIFEGRPKGLLEVTLLLQILQLDLLCSCIEGMHNKK